MSARSSVEWLIRWLRLKINDEGVTAPNSDQYYAGDSIKLTCEYTDIDGTPADPTSPTITIWDPSGTVMVDGATPTNLGVPGTRYYIYRIPATGPEGIWRVEFTGIIDGYISEYPIEFEVGISNRIWTDDELQNFLDMHRVHIRREPLVRDVSKKTYYSRYSMFEDDVTLWDGSGESATQVTPISSNLVDGAFTFATEQEGDYYLDGKSYDIHGAISECMEQLAMDPNKARAWERGGVKYTQYDYMEMAKYHKNLAGVRGIKIAKTYS